MKENKRWIEWARELQFLAQCGLAYSDNEFDMERFQRIREIAAEMVSAGSGMPLEQVKELFCSESGYQTPKLDTRAAVFKEGKILLVREKNGRWSLPGGWVDADQSIAGNTVKEVSEEAGLKVRAVRLIAVQDRKNIIFPSIFITFAKFSYCVNHWAGNSRKILKQQTAVFSDQKNCPDWLRKKITRNRSGCVLKQQPIRAGRYYLISITAAKNWKRERKWREISI